MNIDVFWEIVEKCKDSDEPDLALELLLKMLPPDEVISFKGHFEHLYSCAYRFDLWGAAWLLNDGWCSDDGFEYFRYGLISKGRQVYENAVRNPDGLVAFWKQPSLENEAFGYVPRQVYEEMTGNEMPCFWEQPGYVFNGNDYPSVPESEDWDFNDERENHKRLPKLSELYYAKEREELRDRATELFKNIYGPHLAKQLYKNQTPQMTCVELRQLIVDLEETSNEIEQEKVSDA